jgi:flagellar protein FlaF
VAVAEIIGAAVGVMLLIIVAYLLVGNTLVAAETAANAQKDFSLLNEVRLRTSIGLSEISYTAPILYFNVTNNGNEIISDFDHMDIYTFDGTTDYQSYTYDKYSIGTPGNWSFTQIVPDINHPNQLDPGEKMWAWATVAGADPQWVQVTTANGVYASAYV